METHIIKSLTKNFESFVNKTENEIEFWFARDIQQLLGYAEWRNFLNVVSKAKTACELSDQLVSDHFVDINKTIKMPKTAEKIVPDIMLTRYACYLIAQNGDSRKEEIAFAQTYFAVQTRKLEIIENGYKTLNGCQFEKNLVKQKKSYQELFFSRLGAIKILALSGVRVIRLYFVILLKK